MEINVFQQFLQKRLMSLSLGSVATLLDVLKPPEVVREGVFRFAWRELKEDELPAAC